MLAYSRLHPSISIPNSYIYMHILMLALATSLDPQFICVRLWHETEMALCSPTPCHLACSYKKHSRFPYLSVSPFSLTLSILIPLVVFILVLVGLLLSCFIVGIRYL